MFNYIGNWCAGIAMDRNGRWRAWAQKPEFSGDVWHKDCFVLDLDKIGIDLDKVPNCKESWCGNPNHFNTHLPHSDSES